MGTALGETVGSPLISRHVLSAIDCLRLLLLTLILQKILQNSSTVSGATGEEPKKNLIPTKQSPKNLDQLVDAASLGCLR